MLRRPITERSMEIVAGNAQFLGMIAELRNRPIATDTLSLAPSTDPQKRGAAVISVTPVDFSTFDPVEVPLDPLQEQ